MLSLSLLLILWPKEKVKIFFLLYYIGELYLWSTFVEGDQCKTTLGTTLPITVCAKECNNRFNPPDAICDDGLKCCSDLNLPPEYANWKPEQEKKQQK